MERMTLITVLLVFLLGYACCAWIMPLLDNIFNTIAIWLQKIQSQIAIINLKIKQELDEEVSTRAIGFTILKEEDKQYEED